MHLLKFLLSIADDHILLLIPKISVHITPQSVLALIWEGVNQLLQR